MKLAEKLADGNKFNLKETAEFACEEIKHIIQKYGPRAPGSEAEFRAQKRLAKLVSKWSDKVEIEEFVVHRQAFMGFIPFTVLMAIISTFLFVFDKSLIAFILLILGAIPLVFEFVMYKKFLDPFFPGHTSHNVIARRAPREEIKKRIIFCGHSDSQYEWTLNYKLGGNGMKAFLIPAVVGMIVLIFLSLIRFIAMDIVGVSSEAAATFFKVLSYAMFVFVPCYIGFLFFQNPFRSVPGANDNLSGCFVAMGVLKSLDEAGIRFKNTEVCVLFSGSEEAGLRGAKDYAKRHKDELTDDDIETVVIALDTFRDLSDLNIYDRDLSGTVKHNKHVKKLVKKAGENCGLDLKYASVYIGASDAAAFTQQGVKATCFAAMDPTPPRYYHTRLDNWDILVPEAIEKGLEVMVETACLYDQKGLDD